jgi:PKD domain/SdrD B-like domain
MKRLRVTLIAVALLALPFVAGAAQTRTQTRTQARSGVRPTDAQSDCKDQQAASLARAQAEGRDAPYGLDKKCDDPVPPNQLPVASFVFSCNGLACSFTSTSGDPDGTVASYAWTFGDGGTSAAQNPSYTYAAAGSYPVTLTVTDNAGASSSPTSQTATVSAPSPPPSDPPPTGIHSAKGVVFEDVDGNGIWNVFAGEMGLAGWTVELYWGGQLVTSTTTDADGNYLFPNLGNSTTLWAVCVVQQPTYTRTAPVNGDACGGAGITFLLNGTYRIEEQVNFGEMIP